MTSCVMVTRQHKHTHTPTQPRRGIFSLAKHSPSSRAWVGSVESTTERFIKVYKYLFPSHSELPVKGDPFFLQLKNV